MPRHAYVSSMAVLTAGKSGYVPASNRPNFMLSEISEADVGLQLSIRGRTAALNTAPSAAFFCERSLGTSPIL
jgi:hypothetical protein